MPDPSTIFAWIVTVLAGLATIGALAYAITWSVCSIRRTLAQDRAVSRFDPSTRYWREHSALVIPEAEHEPIRDGATRLLAGDGLRDIAQERQP